MDQPQGFSFTHVGSYQAGEHPRVYVQLSAVDSHGFPVGGPLPTSMLLDSGADVSLVPDSFAVLLGVDLGSLDEREVEGVHGDKVMCREGTLLIGICDAWFPAVISFHPHFDDHDAVLGRDGVFAGLHLALLHSEGKVYGACA